VTREQSVIEPVFLLDTNICIYLLEGRSEIAAQRVSNCPVGQIVTSAIVYAEVMIGAVRLNKADAAMAFFDQIPVVSFDNIAGDAYSQLPFKRANYDRLIAAHAVALGLILVTNNESDFADMPGLRLENWTV
jgi:tRNA(fMet)-specific endonuclease VapC